MSQFQSQSVVDDNSSWFVKRYSCFNFSFKLVIYFRICFYLLSYKVNSVNTWYQWKELGFKCESIHVSHWIAKELIADSSLFEGVMGSCKICIINTTAVNWFIYTKYWPALGLIASASPNASTTWFLYISYISYILLCVLSIP